MLHLFIFVRHVSTFLLEKTVVRDNFRSIRELLRKALVLKKAGPFRKGAGGTKHPG